jgi:hypothetical protein
MFGHGVLSSHPNPDTTKPLLTSAPTAQVTPAVGPLSPDGKGQRHAAQTDKFTTTSYYSHVCFIPPAPLAPLASPPADQKTSYCPDHSGSFNT